MESTNGIQVEGLVREFKNGPRAVDGIDLEVAPGEIYGFLGPNGAGKSTTVHMLTTLLPPTAGTATVAGHDIVREGPAVRDVIGVALQDAALDLLLTGREHMRLQGGLHGLSAAEIKQHGDALLERVGLAEAADRRVGGYSGGMKRRLDLALALVHGPRVLFLDEPTTGLDIQSRAALWDEVARLARDQGVTVFLTTQYLEEADTLADRVGIIDHGRLVTEGTPAALKAEIGRPTVEATPADPGDRDLAGGVLERFGESVPGDRRSRRSPAGRRRGARRHRPGARLRGSATREPRASRPDAQRRLPEADRALARGGRRRGHRGAGHRRARAPAGGGVGERLVERGVRQPPFARRRCYLAWRSVIRTARQPIIIVPPLVFPLFLLAINASGLGAATNVPGFPADTYLAFALAFPFMQGSLFATNTAGTNIAEDIGSGFFNRLSLTPMRGPSLLAGQLTGVLLIGTIQAIAFLAAGLAAGVEIAIRRPGGAGALRALAFDLRRVRHDRAVRRLAHRLRRGVQGLFPLMFILLFLSSAVLPRDLIAQDWFRTVATINPVSYLIEGLRSLIITGWDAEALALGFGVAIAIFVARAHGGDARAAREAGAHVSRRARYLAVVRTVAWRNLHSAVRHPALLLPALVFPLFFYMAFAGGLSTLGNLPGFDYYDYDAFQFVFVLLQSAAFGGVFIGFSIGADFDSGFTRRLFLSAHRPLRGDCRLRGRGRDPGGVRVGDGLRDRPGDRDARRRRRDRAVRADRPRPGRQRRLLPVRGGDDDPNAHPAGGAGDAAPRLPDPDDGAGLRAARPTCRAGSRRLRSSTP